MFEVLILCGVSLCLGMLLESMIDSFRRHTGIIQLNMDETLNRPKITLQLDDNPLYKKSGTKYVLRLQNDIINEYRDSDP